MSKLTKTDVAINGLMSALPKIVEEWQPGELSSELQYRDSLVKHLREAIP